MQIAYHDKNTSPINHFSQKIRIFLIIVVFLVVSIAVFFIMQNLLSLYRNMVREESDAYLEEISYQISANTINKLSGWDIQLQNIVILLEKQNTNNTD